MNAVFAYIAFVSTAFDSVDEMITDLNTQSMDSNNSHHCLGFIPVGSQGYFWIQPAIYFSILSKFFFTI